MPDSDRSLDERVFEVLEARERSGAVAEACLERLQASSQDGGRALRSALERLDEAGLLEEDAFGGRRVGPYVLARRLARGGMGEVFLARDSRGDGAEEVAIKLLRRDLEDDPSSRARFDREVEVVRRLRHPGIASLLDAGVHEGLPYLVFERIDGVTLEAAIRACRRAGEAPEHATSLALALDETVSDAHGASDADLFSGSWADAVARVGREVARALAHAHSRGVIHRDVKPSNVMITAAGKVVLLDFGLATLEGADRMTLSGQRVGSLPFMAPEVLRGTTGATAASDIYSLGVTLYELAALRSPFEADEPGRLAAEIVAGVVRSARRVARGVPDDLDRCISCAMEVSPALRYAAAEALAADLSGFLEGRPVRARSSSTIRTLVRWSRRHPARATGLAALATFLVLGPLAYALIERSHSRETGRLNGQLARSLAEESAALRSATLAGEKALDAVNSQLRWLATIGLDDLPGGADVRAKVLADAFRILDELPDHGPLAPRAQWVRATLLRTRGELRFGEREFQRALDDQETSIALLEDLRDALPLTVGQMEYELGSLLAMSARTLVRLGREDEVAEVLGRGIALMRRSHELGWGDDSVLPGLAQASANLASLRRTGGDLDGALEACEEARAWLADAPDAIRSAPRARLALGQSYRVSANVAWARGDAASAIADYLQGRAIVEPVLDDHPFDRETRRALATTCQQIALVRMKSGDLDGPVLELERAAEILAGLARDYPEWHEPEVDRLDTVALRAQLALGRGRFDDAVRLAEEVIDGWRSATHLPRHLEHLAASLSNRAGLVWEIPSEDPDRFAEAQVLVDEAIELMETHDFRYDDPEASWRPYYVRAVLRARQGDSGGARTDVDAMAWQLDDTGRADPRFRRYRADAWAELLEVLDGEDAAARQDVEVALLDDLEAAVEAGYANLNDLAGHPLLAPVRESARFRAMVQRVRDRAGSGSE